MQLAYTDGRAVGTALRQPPHNIDAESALLGAILVNNEAHDRVSSFLLPEHFFDQVHASIYEVTAKLIGAGKQATPITLRTFFETAEMIDNLTVPQYLGRLAVNATTIINAADYGRAIHDLFVRRQLILTSEDLLDRAYNASIDEPVAELIQAGADAIGELRDRSARSTLRPVTFADLVKMDLTPPEWIVENLLRERCIAMVYAWRGGGKTWFALGLGLAIATGSTFLRWLVERPRRVLHVCGEMPAVALCERLRPIAGSMLALPSDGYRILSSDLHERGLPDLASSEGQHQFDQHVGDAEVVILDNVSTLFRSGAENEAESWASVQQWLLGHRRQGRSIIIIHHAGKGRAQRGTSKREDILDVVLNLRAPVDYEPSQGARFEVHFEKFRGLTGDQVKPFEAQLEVRAGSAVWTTKDLEDAFLSEVEALRDAGRTVRNIAKELETSPSRVGRAFKKLDEREGK